MNKNINNKRFPIKELYIAALLLLAFLYRILHGKWGLNELGEIQDYGSYFIFATLISGVTFLHEIYRKEIINRGMIAVGLFFFIGSAVFLINNSAVTMYYDEYTSLTMFVSLTIVGIITTFYSSVGFIGVESDDKNAVKNASIKLLWIALLGTVWAVVARYCGAGPFLYSTLPACIWIWTDLHLARKLKRPDTRGWTFKW